MKENRIIAGWLVLLALSTFNSTAYAQTPAFTYQGQLNANGSAANGLYDLRFEVWDTLTNGNMVAGPMTNSATGVTNGLFAVTLDFGNGVFTGPGRWLQLDVRTNENGTFIPLLPRQQILPTPYAIMANTASNLAGTVGNSQLTHSTLTVNAGTGLSDGGTVTLGGSTTLSNAGILSVTGNSDITASASGGAVTLGSSATSANTHNTIVKRDASGNFAAGSLTLTGTVLASDVKLASGTQSVVSSLDSTALSIVRGNINQDGTTFNGSGFSVVKTGTGSYTVNFTSAFSDTPSVVCQIASPSAGTVTTAYVNLNTLSVYTWSGSSLSDNNFSFLAVGGR